MEISGTSTWGLNTITSLSLSHKHACAQRLNSIRNDRDTIKIKFHRNEGQITFFYRIHSQKRVCICQLHTAFGEPFIDQPFYTVLHIRISSQVTRRSVTLRAFSGIQEGECNRNPEKMAEIHNLYLNCYQISAIKQDVMGGTRNDILHLLSSILITQRTSGDANCVGGIRTKYKILF